MRTLARRIAATVVVAGALLGPATGAFAVDAHPPQPLKLPPKSCTWVATGAVVPSGNYFKEDNGSMWKCTNGSWSAANQKARTQQR